MLLVIVLSAIAGKYMPQAPVLSPGPAPKLISDDFEHIEFLKTIVERLLSFQSSGTELPDELLKAYFTPNFQEKYKRLSQKTFAVSNASQKSIVRKITKVSDSQWHALVEVLQQDGSKNLLAFKLSLENGMIDQLALESNPKTDIPTISGSNAVLINLNCAWENLKLTQPIQWLKSPSSDNYLIGYNKSSLANHKIELHCGNHIFTAGVDEGVAFLSDSMLGQEIVPKKIGQKPSELEKRLRDTLGFTIE